MARVVAIDGGAGRIAIDDWEMALSPPQAWAGPEQAAGPWLTARAPGTAAAALAAAGRWRLEAPSPLHDQDVWYRVRLAGPGPRILRLEGLATIATVWLDGRPLLSSDNMFHSHVCEVVLQPESWLHIAFRSLTAALSGRGGRRARWRPQMIPEQRLRLVRTSLLGHMPGWCPAVDVVGPWRPVILDDPGAAPVVHCADIRTELIDGVGRISAVLDLGIDPGPAALCCAGRTGPLRPERASDGTVRLTGQLDIPDVAPWWPHTHGTPALHGLTIAAGDHVIDCGQVGFRSVMLDRDDDGQGFALVVNGEPVFCRGACWTPQDIVGLSDDPAALRAALEQVRAAGLNMLRLSGTMTYESDRFHAHCDELGIMVWQDLMLANFDYPADDPGFAASIRREISDLLDRLQTSPSLVVVCGGSEVAQQAAMMGLPSETWSGPVDREILPEAVARLRPDLVVVPSSPSGGDLPFVADAGVTHYYGVGAYRRPLEDARRAGVRFAAECLAFAHVPAAATLAADLPVPPGHDPRWKARVPRDLGAAWDFEDVRDHYLQALYGLDPARLRSEDPERYLDLSRAVTADVVEATLAEWRRPQSPTAGALVWFWKDFLPGAGWGLIDARGVPKSAWYALRRVCQPVQVLLSDEGVNGLHLHVLNETAAPLALSLALRCLRHGRTPVASGQQALELPPRSARTLPAAALFGRFFDTTYAYRFGPPAHDVCVARLTGTDGAVRSEAFFWLGNRAERRGLGLGAALARDADGWTLRVRTESAAARVSIADPHYLAEDDWFDLDAGAERTLRLQLRPGVVRPDGPEGLIRAVNGLDLVRYAAPQS